MTQSPPLHRSIRILLINDEKKILLLRADDPSTTSIDGSNYGPFWFTLGGRIESGEQEMDAAVRELYEETGLRKEDVEFGPIVWYGTFNLVLSGELMELHQRFIIARTKKSSISFENLTSNEKKVINDSKWFGISDIQTSKEVVFPLDLAEYLTPILEGKYPKMPIEIDLGKDPVTS